VNTHVVQLLTKNMNAFTVVVEDMETVFEVKSDYDYSG